MSKIIRYIFSILKDFMITLLKAISTMLFIGVIAIPILLILSIIPIFVANSTNSIFLFILTYVIEFVLIDLILDGQSDTIDYFANKWKNMKSK